jgi:hypothetical protein
MTRAASLTNLYSAKCLEGAFSEVCFARRAGININVKKGQPNPNVAALKPALLDGRLRDGQSQ